MPERPLSRLKGSARRPKKLNVFVRKLRPTPREKGSRLKRLRESASKLRKMPEGSEKRPKRQSVSAKKLRQRQRKRDRRLRLLSRPQLKPKLRLRRSVLRQTRQSA